MEAGLEKVLGTVEADAEKLWTTIEPYVQQHVSELLQFALADAEKVCAAKIASAHNPVTIMELKALEEVFKIVAKALVPSSGK